MSNATYQVILSTDGKHTVIVTSDDPQAIKEASSWAQATYERLVERYGLKGEQRASNGDRQQEETVPECAIHHVPMVLVEGKRGPFWSCHERNEDGSWCKYRPKG
jgi:hypothetical protein